MKKRGEGHQVIKVCTIGDQSFGLHNLNRLLKRSNRVRIFHRDDTNSSRNIRDGAKTIFILDTAAVGPPLSRCLRTLRSLFPKGCVLALGKRIPDDELCRLISMGVDGFLHYDEIEQDLRSALCSLAEGRPWIAPEVLAQYLAYSRRSQHTQPEANLTERESEVLGLVARAFSNKEISTQLGIAERTVKFHLGNAFAKLGVNSRQAAVERMKVILDAAPQPSL